MAAPSSTAEDAGKLVLRVAVGLWTRPAALLVAATMAVALVLGHPNELFAMTNHGGLLLEVQWMFLLGALAVALLGAGRLGLDARNHHAPADV